MTGPGRGPWSAIDDASDSSAQVAYLDRATWQIRRWKWRSYQWLRVGRGNRVLDVGCGTGDDARQLALLAGRTGMAVGVDLSRVLLREARARSTRRGRHASFIAADVRGLPFASRGFDACRAERVLQHVADPAQAIAEMVRVTKPGGRVVITEPDAGMTVIDADDVVTTRALLDSRLDDRTAPAVGRQLSDHLVRSGLVDVWVLGTVDIVRDLRPAEQTMGLRGIADRAVASGIVSCGEAGAWISDLEQRSATGRFLVAYVKFTAGGRKPGGRRRRASSLLALSRRWVVQPNRLGLVWRMRQRARG